VRASRSRLSGGLDEAHLLSPDPGRRGVSPRLGRVASETAVRPAGGPEDAKRGTPSERSAPPFWHRNPRLAFSSASVALRRQNGGLPFAFGTPDLRLTRKRVSEPLTRRGRKSGPRVRPTPFRAPAGRAGIRRPHPAQPASRPIAAKTIRRHPSRPGRRPRARRVARRPCRTTPPRRTTPPLHTTLMSRASQGKPPRRTKPG